MDKTLKEAGNRQRRIHIFLGDDCIFEVDFRGIIHKAEAKTAAFSFTIQDQEFGDKANRKGRK